MNNKLKLTIGLAVSAGTIVFCSWQFYKTWQMVKADREAYKEVQEGVEEDIKEQEKQETDDAVTHLKELERKRIERAEQLYKDTYESEEEDDIYDLTDEYESDIYVDNQEESGEEELRHDKNSREALNQFMMMNLSDIQNPDVARVLDELYRVGVDLLPCETVYSNLFGEREEFFGSGSKWNSDLSVSDILFYYARLEYQDLDTPVEDNILVYLENLGVYDESQMVKFDSRRLPVSNFVYHDYWHDGRFGMFGLDDQEVNELIDTAIRTQGNRDITFQAEYNKHLEALI